MRIFLKTLLASSLVFAGACTGSAIIGGGGGGGGADDDDAVADDDDAVGDDDDAVETSPFEGTHELGLMLIGSFGGGGEEPFCFGWLDLEVDEAGAFTGEGECEMEWGNGGGFIFEASGGLSAEGELSDGLMLTARTRGNQEWRESEIEGGFDDDLVAELEWTGSVEIGWGDPISYEGVAYTDEDGDDDDWGW